MMVPDNASSSFEKTSLSVDSAAASMLSLSSPPGEITCGGDLKVVAGEIKRELRCLLTSMDRSYQGRIFFIILFSADAFSFRQTSERIFLVRSSENGRFGRPPKHSVPEAERFSQTSQGISFSL